MAGFDTIYLIFVKSDLLFIGPPCIHIEDTSYTLNN